jgi:hypothetical protein
MERHVELIAFDDLASRIAQDGADAHAVELAGIARRARAEGRALAAVSVLTDPGAPEVVRARAFAVVARALTWPCRMPTGDLAEAV